MSQNPKTSEESMESSYDEENRQPDRRSAASDAEKGHDSPDSSGCGWIGLSILVGCVLGVPTGWLLAYLSALPGFLGLFFYLLFGLIIGAAMYRAARPAIPARPWQVWTASLIVTAATLISSLYAEYWELPRSVDTEVRNTFYESFTAERREALRLRTQENVEAFLEANYPPGGFVGFLTWASTSGQMEAPRGSTNTTVAFELPQRQWVWLLRVLLSGLLLAWIVLALTLPLTKPVEQPTQPAPGSVPGESSSSDT